MTGDSPQQKAPVAEDDEMDEDARKASDEGCIQGPMPPERPTMHLQPNRPI